MSLKNFRDLSYLKNSDGRSIRKGLIFRSGVLFCLNNNSINLLNRLKIDEIIDLRSLEEIKRKPDTSIDSKYVIIPFANPDFKPEEDSIDRYSLKTYWLNRRCSRATRDHEFAFYANIYSKNIYNNPAIREIFTLMNKHKSFLFHCHGGKDRTGVCALLVLAALGFDRNAIIRDYLKTNNPLQVLTMKYGLKLFGFNTNGIDVVLVNTFAIRELIESTFSEIEASYQTIDNFLLKEYSVTEAMIEDYRNYYLDI